MLIESDISSDLVSHDLFSWCIISKLTVCCVESIVHTLCSIILSLFSGQWLCEVERFDPRTNQWSMIAPMHHSRTGVAVTALKGIVKYTYVRMLCLSH